MWSTIVWVRYGKEGYFRWKIVLLLGAGGSASGKTSISRQVYEFLKEVIQHVSLNKMTIIKIKVIFLWRKSENKLWSSFAFDNDLLVEQLKQLKEGKSISKPTYDYTQHTRSDVVETITPRDVYILEGLFVLYDEKLEIYATFLSL